MSDSDMKVATYGAWASPVTADLIVGETVRLGEIEIDGEDILWLEGRPQQQGSQIIVRRTADRGTSDATPEGYNVRTRVHEYGGGAFVADRGTLYFSNFDDQRLYLQEPGKAPKAIGTPEGMRYADANVDQRRRRLILVREHHCSADEPINTLVAVDLEPPHTQTVLVSTHDFFSTPRLDPAGKRLAWLAWNHPNMPWDGTELWLADVADDGALVNARIVAGGNAESVFQPSWSPEGQLHFICDRSGWWNLYRVVADRIEALQPMPAEFGVPQWVFDLSTYGFDARGRIVCTYAKNGRSHLAMLDPQSKTLREIPTPFTYIANVRVVRDFVAFIGGSPAQSDSVVRLDLDSGRHEVLRRSSNVQIDAGYLSVPEQIEFETTGGATAHGYFYAPRNRDFRAPYGEKPPLLVLSHGGPTTAANDTLSPSIQFWTSRGFAVVDVNYGGSTGYGREYRQRLLGKWGIVDVDDVVSAARYLVARDAADSLRLAIRGGSAGGYTTLAALTFRNVFTAGASYYGVADLESLARDTHKFESRYLDSLIGPYPAEAARYRERSPIHFTDRLAAPMILFQGLEDKVVPPNQAQMMFDAVRNKGVPVAYVAFPGEQHGFRQAATIKRTLEAELYFYGKVFGFTPADPIEPVRIDNLPRR